MYQLEQVPSPGEHRLQFKGDTVQFVLRLPSPLKGRAFLRTNIAKSTVRKKEIIEKVEMKRSMRAQDWHDLPMIKVDDYTYSIELALLEVGHFEGKCLFFRDNIKEPLWPAGENVALNVEPAEYCCANSIYCAFIRQFGENKPRLISKPIDETLDAEVNKLDEQGITIIPQSGKFRDLILELDHIVYKLKCRIIHLLPVNPTPTVFARMGRFGSPYASLDFTGIDLSLAEFDCKVTPLEQFFELVDAIHARNARLIIDVAINHTGWGAKLHEDEPGWLVRENDGTIVSPGAWGVVWGDLTELDYTHQELWEHIAKVFLTWCSRGVDGFRCDAGYMIPVPVWEYIIAKVKTQYPDTVFLLEGLGGDVAITLDLLNKANMNWAYSELFQNYTRDEIEKYINRSHFFSLSDGVMVHYAETHDNNRLACNSKTYSKMRTALSALTSSNGAFGFTNGVEWFAEEKIDVHKACGLNWGSKPNMVSLIGRLNTILITHPAFHCESKMYFIDSGSDKVVAFIRCDPQQSRFLLILLNLDCEKLQTANICMDATPFSCFLMKDLITEKDVQFTANGTKRKLQLQGGQFLCLTPQLSDLFEIIESDVCSVLRPDRLELQCARAMALEITCWKNRSSITVGVDTENLAGKLLENPHSFCQALFGHNNHLAIVYWNWPEDTRRQVMVPPDHLLLVTAPSRFRASILRDNVVLAQKDSLRDGYGRFFAVFTPLPSPIKHVARTMKIAVFNEKQCFRSESSLLLLTDNVDRVATAFTSYRVNSGMNTFLGTNKRGGMLRASLKWSHLDSRYDALLAANLNEDHPEDRHIMLARYRVWLIFHGRSVELSQDITDEFLLNEEGGGTWNFHIPVGNGLFVDISVALSMESGKNLTKMDVYRKGAKGLRHYLGDDSPVRLVIRPDIDDRNFHTDTKANQDLESKWRNSIVDWEKGFKFAPAENRILSINSTRGLFKREDEWIYSVFHKIESERGLEAHGDLYSPGYFELVLNGKDKVQLIAEVHTEKEQKVNPPKAVVNFNKFITPASDDFEALMLESMKAFVVKRGNLKTVIAGYPWFLDWGRDTLICVRGMIAAGMLNEVRDILLQFAKFAKKGTLPNMIHGSNASNRDTSDAPLWFIVVCEDYCRHTGKNDFLMTKVDKKRTLTDVLVSIVEGYFEGTDNGIKMDPASGLVYSPSHFTWMDTNFPAGTPREGYPIEIQSLWFAGLNFLGKTECKDSQKWNNLSKKVKKSIKKYFVIEKTYTTGGPLKEKWLSDCLHCSPMKPASKSIADDHIRSNQLFAITLGAVSTKDLAMSILRVVYSLLVPGAIRSLADRKVDYEAPIYGPDKMPLNNPEYPYWGRYEGDEDTRRKPAYHNGTAWTWPFPSYSEAYFNVYGSDGKMHAKSILSSSSIIYENGCVAQIPEIIDGNYPHHERGCDAQAWGITELYRVWRMLK